MGGSHRFSILLSQIPEPNIPSDPQKDPSLVGFGEGSRCPGPTENERSPKVFSFLQSEEVALLRWPVVVSKLFHSWVGKRSSSNGIHALGQGWKGLQKNSDSWPGRIQSGAGRKPKTDPTEACGATHRPRVCGDPLRPPGDPLRRHLLTAPCSRAQPLLDASGAGRTSESRGCAALRMRESGCEARAGYRGRGERGAPAWLA